MNQGTAKRAGLILVPVIILASIGGVWVLLDSSDQESSAIGSVNIAPDRTVPTTSPFHLEGEIHYQIDPSQVDDSSFEDVMLCMYDSKRNVIASENLGTFDGSAEYVNISSSTDSVPDLILVHHPRFYSIDGFQIYAFKYMSESDQFSQLNADHISFPYNRLDRGTCTPAS